MQEIFDATLAATKKAGDIVMSFYQSSFTVKDKSPDNPVTDADLASDAYLKETLLAILPEAGWLSEETKDNPDRLDKEFVWVVDPIDGTKEFVMGIPEFSISVGLVQNGVPVLGIILNPETDELFAGFAGNGVQYKGANATPSKRAELTGSEIDASRSEIKRGEFEIFEDKVTLKIVGSIAYKLARVSAGICDGTWSRGPKNEWDICAGDFLIREAGGQCVDLNRELISYNKPHSKVNGIIATNGHIHDELLALLGPLGAARSEPDLPVKIFD